MRRRLRRYAAVEGVEELLAGLRKKGRSFEEGKPERFVLDDPKDDYPVALTRVSGADYLVSGDPYLIGLADKGTTNVSTPRRFAELLLDRRPVETHHPSPASCATGRPR